MTGPTDGPVDGAGAGTADALAGEFGGVLQPRAFSDLPEHQAFVRLDLEGYPREPERAAALPRWNAPAPNLSSALSRRTLYRASRDKIPSAECLASVDVPIAFMRYCPRYR